MHFSNNEEISRRDDIQTSENFQFHIHCMCNIYLVEFLFKMYSFF